MKGSLFLFLLLWGFWILLSGGLLIEEIVIGGIVSLIISALFGYFFSDKATTRYVKGLVFFLMYVPYKIAHEVIDVLDVSYRIITGKINPGIIEIDHTHTHNWGITILANSITMMPGTLTLEAKPKKLYMHWINVTKDKHNATTRFQRALKHVWD